MKTLIYIKTVIVPFYLPWNWSADYQKQTCLELAKKYKVIAYMENQAIFFLKALFRKKFDRDAQYKNITFYRPTHYIPFQRFTFIQRANRTLSFMIFQLLYLTNKHNLLWIFEPDFYYLLKPTKGAIVYDCVDFVWSRQAEDAEKIQELEKKLIRESTYFFVNSRVLAKHHSKIRKPDGIVPQGFRFADFKRARIPSKEFPRDKPIIGYVGAINHRLDFKLLLSLIQRNPKWSFVLWGFVQELEAKDLAFTETEYGKLASCNNVIMGRSLSRKEIPSVVRQFDIAMIPYDTSLSAVWYCYPMKLFEYFYMGKPVISTPIEELKRYPKYVKIGATAREWEEHIRVLLSKPWPREYARHQRRLAIDNSWEKKIGAIVKAIGIE